MKLKVGGDIFNNFLYKNYGLVLYFFWTLYFIKIANAGDHGLFAIYH